MLLFIIHKGGIFSIIYLTIHKSLVVSMLFGGVSKVNIETTRDLLLFIIRKGGICH